MKIKKNEGKKPRKKGGEKEANKNV